VDCRRNGKTINMKVNGSASYAEISDQNRFGQEINILKKMVNSERKQFFEYFTPDCIMIST